MRWDSRATLAMDLRVCLWSPVLLLIRITIKNHRLVVPRVVGHRVEAA